MGQRWIKRWQVESHSTPEKFYTVALDENGEYGCSCPAWKYRRQECEHIREIKRGQFEPDTTVEHEEPTFILANVEQVKPAPGTELVNGKPEKVLIPLIPANDTHFTATVIHDMLCFGFSWASCQKHSGLAQRNAKQDIIAYVQQRGRRIYGRFVQGRGHTGFRIVPCETPYVF